MRIVPGPSWRWAGALGVALLLVVPFGAAELARPHQGNPLILSLDGSGAILLGQTDTLYANASGGVPPYTFHWSLNGTTVRQNVTNLSSSGQRFTFAPLGDGIYALVVVVNDSGTNSTSQRLEIYVTGPGPIVVDLTVVGPAANGTLLVHAHALGGRAPYSYRWTGPGAPAGWGPSPNLTVPSLPSGVYVVHADARDATGFMGTAELTIHRSTGTPPPAFPLYGWFAIGVAVSFALVLTVLYARHRRAVRPPPPEPRL